MFTNVGSGMIVAFLPFILYLLLTGFGIYFVIKVTKFMNVKTKLDHERNENIDKLIKVISNRENNK